MSDHQHCMQGDCVISGVSTFATGVRACGCNCVGCTIAYRRSAVAWTAGVARDLVTLTESSDKLGQLTTELAKKLAEYVEKQG